MRASDLATRIGAKHVAGPDRDVTGLCPPVHPTDNGACLALSVAGVPLPAPAAVIVPAAITPSLLPWVSVRAPDCSILAASNAKLAYARAAALLGCQTGVTGDAQDAPAHAGPGVYIGEGCRFGPGVVVGQGARIGSFTVIGAHSVIGPGVSLGNRVRIGPLSSVGHAPFDYARDGGRWIPLPALGGVVIEDDAVLGARVTVPAGCSRPTRIGADCKLDDGVHIGHDAIVGSGTVMAAGAKLGGYVRLGSLCKIGGQAAIAEGVAIADSVTVTATSAVSRDVTVPGQTIASGWPAMPARQWWRLVSRVRALGSTQDRPPRDE